ncbi:MAG: hypothetical protein HLUCCA01_09615 [Bacteroidetes bacterium HLUCCA01]|nr:MAG: hypothetical protein HLUCCA01_09615 [Bacteroidetes bacterium HLUCCA01]
MGVTARRNDGADQTEPVKKVLNHKDDDKSMRLDVPEDNPCNFGKPYAVSGGFQYSVLLHEIHFIHHPR